MAIWLAKNQLKGILLLKEKGKNGFGKITGNAMITAGKRSKAVER